MSQPVDLTAEVPAEIAAVIEEIDAWKETSLGTDFPESER